MKVNRAGSSLPHRWLTGADQLPLTSSKIASRNKRNGNNRRTRASVAEMPTAPAETNNNADSHRVIDASKDALGAFLTAPSRQTT